MLLNDKVFLDINVIVDFNDSKRPRHLQAVKLVEYLIEYNFDICISEDMVSTIFYISKDKIKTLNFLNYIVNAWIVCGFGNDVMLKAIDIAINNALDLEDVLQCLCAKENNCDALITNDTTFYDCGLKIYTVGEFLNNEKNF